MEQKDLELFIEKVKLAAGEKVSAELTALQKSMNELIEAKASNEQLIAVKAEIMTALEKQSEIIKGFKTQGEPEFKSVIQLAKEHIEGNKEVKAAIESGENVKFQVKVAGDITIAGSTSTTATAPHGATYGVDPNMVMAFAKKPRIADLFEGSQIAEETHVYTEQRAKDGAAAWKTEGASADKIDYSFVSSSSSVKEVKVRTKISKKALKYINNLYNTITQLVTRDLRIKVSYDLLYSDNTSTPEAIKGITVYDIPYPTSSSFDLDVPNAKMADALVCSKSVILSRDADEVNFVVVNPTDEAKLLIERDKQQAGQANIVMVGNTMTVNGVPIVVSNQVEAGYFLMGNSALFDVHPSGAIDIELGNSGTDLDAGMKTIYVSQFYHVFLKENYSGAFIYAKFSDVIAQINKPQA